MRSVKQRDVNAMDQQVTIYHTAACSRSTRAMVAHPILIERPIVVHGNAARIGRPPKNVLGILQFRC